MSSRLSLKAPAKVNLYLEITSDRPDGYQYLVMVLQSINLSDRPLKKKLKPNHVQSFS